MFSAVRHTQRLTIAMPGDLSEYRTLNEYLTARIAASGRKANAISQQIGRSENYLYNILGGVRPSSDTVRAIARYFGDDEEALLTLSGLQGPQVAPVTPQTRDLVIDYVARNLPQMPPERSGSASQTEPPPVTLVIGDREFAIYLPAAADRYTPEQLARLIEDLLQQLL